MLSRKAAVVPSPPANLTGVARRDIRELRFASLSGTADGVPLTIVPTIVSASTCSPLAGRAVYLWHCDRVGRYVLYSSGAANQNYLRGVQEADASGKVMFTSIYPACYSGRWPHIHFEVYPGICGATSVSNKVATSQMAMPEATCDLAYASSGYEASVTGGLSPLPSGIASPAKGTDTSIRMEPASEGLESADSPGRS